MGVKRVKHVQRGSKEASLTIAGSGEVTQETHEKILTPDDAEFHRYSELLKGFFEKFVRWQDILATDEYYKGYSFGEDHWAGTVFRLDTSFMMKPSKIAENDDPANKVLRISYYAWPDPKPGLFNAEFLIAPLSTGKQFFIDPEDNKPLERIKIHVGDQTIAPIGSRFIRIDIDRFPELGRTTGNFRHSMYDLKSNTLKVFNHIFGNDVLTDDMATNLIKTIDALIPGAPAATQQPEHRARQEIQLPKALPPLRSRRPAGR